jgi:hypothetical protein
MSVTASIEVKIITETGEKIAHVSFPTDQHWKKRRRAQAPITHSLGRGTSETSLPAIEGVDLDIYNAIKSPESPELDAFEANFVIDRLAQCRAKGVQRNGNNYVVTLATLFGTKTFELRPPSLRQQIEYKRNIAKVLDLPNNAQKTVINLDFAASTFDALLVSKSGDEEVSLLYKAEASAQVMTEVFRQSEVGEDEDF